MREILFRGKDVKEHWHIGLLAHIGNAWYISNSAGIPTACEVIPSTVGEYTGLKDKNGQRIFEGDIVSMKYNEQNKPYAIIYDEELATFIGRDKDNFNFTTLSGLDNSPIEIIGNIHDSPELLKEVQTMSNNKGCEYCKGRAYTKKPLTVITRYGRRIELTFDYCPKCGRRIKPIDENLLKECD